MDNILDYKNLVNKIVYKYSNSSNFEDLQQVGMIGLLKALDNYKNNDECKFSTYAYKWILGEILEYVRCDRNIKISKDIISLNKKIEACRNILRNEINREPSLDEIAFYLGYSESDIYDAVIAKDYVFSLDYNINEEGDNNLNLYDMISYYDNGLNTDYIDLYSALNNLDVDERKIIEMHYFNGMTQSEISNSLNTNQVNVSRSEAKILKKLNKSLVG